MCLSVALLSPSVFCDEWLEVDCLYSLGIKPTASTIPGVSRDRLTSGHEKAGAEGTVLLGCASGLSDRF